MIWMDFDGFDGFGWSYAPPPTKTVQPREVLMITRPGLTPFGTCRFERILMDLDGF